MLRLNRLSGEINRWVFNETQDPQMYRLQGSYARIWAVSQVSSPHLWWRFSPRHLVTPWVWTSYDDQVGWDAYVVMHMLVLRVPLLMVVPLALQSLLIAAALRLSCTDFWPLIASGLNVTAVLPGMLALSPMESSRRSWWHRTRWRVWFWCCLPELCHMARKVSDRKLHVGLPQKWIISGFYRAILTHAPCAKVCNLQCSRLASDPEEPEIGCTSMVYECPGWKILCGAYSSWDLKRNFPQNENRFAGESNFQRN